MAIREIVASLSISVRDIMGKRHQKYHPPFFHAPLPSPTSLLAWCGLRSGKGPTVWSPTCRFFFYLKTTLNEPSVKKVGENCRKSTIKSPHSPSLPSSLSSHYFSLLLLSLSSPSAMDPYKVFSLTILLFSANNRQIWDFRRRSSDFFQPYGGVFPVFQRHGDGSGRVGPDRMLVVFFRRVNVVKSGQFIGSGI